MTKIGNLNLTGVSGRTYTFNVWPLSSKFSNVSAVYAVTKRTAQGISANHTVVYIGQTSALIERFDDHHKANCFARNSANCLCVLRVNSKDDRLEIEADLIANYNPTCNG